MSYEAYGLSSGDLAEGSSASYWDDVNAAIEANNRACCPLGSEVTVDYTSVE